MIVAVLSVITGEKWGYIRRPLAATNYTVVINIDCNKPRPFPQLRDSLQLPDNATHDAVQLVHCHTVPFVY